MDRIHQKHKKFMEFFPQIKGYVTSHRYDQGKVETKSNRTDLVTEIDKNTESIFRSWVKKEFPNDLVIGEETYRGEKIGGEACWIIDPIDGTTNFVKQADNFSSLIAYFEDGEPLLGYCYDYSKNEMTYSIRGEGVKIEERDLKPLKRLPLKESLVSINSVYWQDTKAFKNLTKSSFGIRYNGSGGLDMLETCKGGLGLYVNHHTGLWDLAPFFLFKNELDLKMCDLEGKEMALPQGGGVIFGTEENVRDFLKL